MVGVPHGEVPVAQAFFRNVGWQGGPAPARSYIPELLDEVLSGTINPSMVLDCETDLDHAADAYAAMDECRAIKSRYGPPIVGSVTGRDTHPLSVRLAKAGRQETGYS
jgi:threonine dehydrogenase-like Zn-dependent dehydrogenase